MPGDNVIALVTPSVFGISETFITRHLRELAPGRTVVVCFDDTNAHRLSCPAIHVPVPDKHPPFRLLTKLRLAVPTLWHGYYRALGYAECARLAEFLGDHSVAVTLAEYGPTACVVRAACERAGTPLFVHFHGNDASAQLRCRWIRYAYRRLLRDAAGIICPSQSLVRNLESAGLPRARIHLVPYGVDEQIFQPDEARRDENLVLAVGRCVPKKAPHLTIEAFARVAEEHPDAKLEVIGDGPLLANCRSLVEQRGLCDRVSLRGAQAHREVSRSMPRAAVFVQHSVTAEDGDSEGLPVTILEAMSCGLPVVATRHAGIPEAAIDGETSLLVDEGDIEGMAAALSALLGNRELARTMGQAGRARVLEAFSGKRDIARLRELLGL